MTKTTNQIEQERIAAAARARAYHRANREIVLSKAKRYRENNSSICSSAKKRWYARHSEHVKAKSKKWAETNLERRREIERDYARKNPKKLLAHAHKRRARLQGSGGSYQPEQINWLFETQDGYCNNLCCFADLILTGFHEDHIIAIARGGSNNIDNIQLLCPTCNHRKGALSWEEFMRRELA